MADLTIKNLPDEVHQRLKEVAARNWRSLNSEITHRLEGSLGVGPLDPERLLARARAVRERQSLPYLTDEDLRVARESGRK